MKVKASEQIMHLLVSLSGIHTGASFPLSPLSCWLMASIHCVFSTDVSAYTVKDFCEDLIWKAFLSSSLSARSTVRDIKESFNILWRDS
jgi:hypothetical protein